MSKSLRDQMADLALVTRERAAAADKAERKRLNHMAFELAMSAARRIQVDHKAVIVEYRRSREVAR